MCDTRRGIPKGNSTVIQACSAGCKQSISPSGAHVVVLSWSLLSIIPGSASKNRHADRQSVDQLDDRAKRTTKPRCDRLPDGLRRLTPQTRTVPRSRTISPGQVAICQATGGTVICPLALSPSSCISPCFALFGLSPTASSARRTSAWLPSPLQAL